MWEKVNIFVIIYECSLLGAKHIWIYKLIKNNLYLLYNIKLIKLVIIKYVRSSTWNDNLDELIGNGEKRNVDDGTKNIFI